MTHNKEENNYPKAVAISTGIMAVLIAISFIIVIGSFQPPEELGMGGMVVNYGTSAEGMGDDYTSIEEPSADPNANNKAPDKVVPDQQVTEKIDAQTSDKEIQTQNTEDAVSINTKSTKNNSNPTTATQYHNAFLHSLHSRPRGCRLGFSCHLPRHHTHETGRPRCRHRLLRKCHREWL